MGIAAESSFHHFRSSNSPDSQSRFERDEQNGAIVERDGEQDIRSKRRFSAILGGKICKYPLKTRLSWYSPAGQTHTGISLM